MISEEFNMKLGEYDYDFNKKNRVIFVTDKKDEKNLLNNIKETTDDKDLKNKEKNKETKKDEKEDNIDNEISIKKEEPPSKKYKVTNLGRNVANLDENYSTDDEDEYKFIQLINESNDDYEKVVDSKTIKVFAKIVSLY
jgi:hypothetical protein